MSAKTPNPQDDDVKLVQQRFARRRTMLGVAALVYLECVVFYPLLLHNFEFVGGDVRSQVINYPHVHGLSAENVKHIFTSRCVTSYYPVRALTFAIDYQRWGLNPRGYKLTNGLIHLANVLLVFWLILRLFRRESAADRPAGTWWSCRSCTRC